MGSLHHFEKTSMVQPNSEVYDNYREAKAELRHQEEMRSIKESKSADLNRINILQETNERLNAEVQRLKKALVDSKRTDFSLPVATPSNDKKHLEQIQKLELALKNEKRKAEKLSKDNAKLEQLLEDVYATEKENSISEEEVMNIKKVNAQLLAMLQRLNKD